MVRCIVVLPSDVRMVSVAPACDDESNNTCVCINVIMFVCVYYGRTLSERPYYFADVFLNVFFMTALVGQTAERIFTKLSHVVDIRCYL